MSVKIEYLNSEFDKDNSSDLLVDYFCEGHIINSQNGIDFKLYFDIEVNLSEAEWDYVIVKPVEYLGIKDPMSGGPELKNIDVHIGDMYLTNIRFFDFEEEVSINDALYELDIDTTQFNKLLEEFINKYKLFENAKDEFEEVVENDDNYLNKYLTYLSNY